MSYQCCSLCFNELVDRNLNLAELWVKLCGFCIEYRGVMRFFEDDFIYDYDTLFSQLESKGFILTCDDFKGVLLRVEGYEISETDGNYLETFCIKREEHVPCP